MSEPLPGSETPQEPRGRLWVRAVFVVLVCTSLALLLSFDAVYENLQRLLAAAEPFISRHPYLGAGAFVVLSALSAMLSFFSSAVLLPAAVFAWGHTLTFMLLWLGWLLGGLCTYALGRGLRGPKQVASKAPGQLEYLVRRVAGQVTFPMILLLCLALPSEVPGYLSGYLGVRLRTYFTALALAELPYAIGAVMLGQGVVSRETGWLVGIGVAGAVFSLVALRVLQQRLERM